MANENNLIPIRKRSSREAREMGKKGGIASGKVRRKKPYEAMPRPWIKSWTF